MRLRNATGITFGQAVQSRNNLVANSHQTFLRYAFKAPWMLRISIIFLILLFTMAIFIRPTFAATANLVPNGDITTQWTILGGTSDATCSGTHCSRIDEPTANDSDYVGTGVDGAGGEVEEFDLTTTSNIASASQVVITVRAVSMSNANGGTLDNLSVNLKVNGVLQTAVTITPAYDAGGVFSNYTAAFSGTWTQADVDSMQVHITRDQLGSGAKAGQDDDIRMSQVFGTLTYTQSVTYNQSSYRWFNNNNSVVRASDDFTKLSNPATLPASNSHGSTFSPDSQYMVVAHEISPFITIYKRSGDTFTKLPNPDVLPASTASTAGFSPDGQHLTVAHNNTPFITIYKRNGDTFTKLANPAALPPSDSYAVTYTPDSQYMATAHSNAPYVSIYKRSGDTYTKLANPAALPPGPGSRATFSPDGVYLSVTSHTTAPFLTIYKRDGDIFNKLPDLANPPTGNAMNSAFSNDGVHFAVTFAVSPFIHIYKRSGDTFTKLADPAAFPTGTPRGLVFTADDQYLLAGHEVSPFMTIYKRSGDTFTKTANPATLPTGNGRLVSISPNMQYLAVPHFTSPFVSIYKNPVTAGAGTAMAAINASTTAPAKGTTFRLRTLASTNIAQADTYAASFKLQYAAKGSAALCSDVVTVNYADVTSTTPIAYANNTNIPNGVNIASTADDPTNATIVHPQTYVEANNLANANSAIPLSESGMWDFALKDNGAPVSTTYCFRIVGSSGSSLANYNYYPEISTQTPTAEQGNWRAYEPGVAPAEDFTKLANPATLPTGAGESAAWSSGGEYLAVAHSTTPFVTIYKRSGDTFTKLPDPAVLPPGDDFSGAEGVAWSPDGTYLTVVTRVSPYMIIYKRSGDTFTKLADPATMPGSITNGATFSPDGTYLSVAHNSIPYVTVYKRSGDTFTKLADPATLPASSGYGLAFSPDGIYLSVAHATTPFVTIYKRSGDTFTKLANPAALPTGTGLGVGFSPDSAYMTVAHDISPFITIYKRSGDTFTKLANPAALPAGAGQGIAWSPSGKYLTIAHATTPFVTIYKQSGDTFTKVANPATLPTSTGRSVAFSPDDTYLSVSHDTTPFITVYKTPPKPVPGNPLATENTAATVTAGNSFRMRQLLKQTASRSDLNTASYKLQYAAKSGTCDIGFSGEAYKDLYAPAGPVTKAPTVAANDTSVGTEAWTNPGNTLASDNSRAEANTSLANTNYLKVTGFGFSVPSNATITGIEVLAEVSSSDPAAVAGRAARLVKGGVIGTTNGTNFGATWPELDTVLTYGTSTDMWGTTLTPADVNASTFGFAVQAGGDMELTRAYVDNIQVKVYYSISTTGVGATYHSTTGIASGAAIATHANDPTATGTIKPQTFVSTDPFNNSVYTINYGEFAMWDFAISTTTEATGSYCFRVVKGDGSLLNTYAAIPEITIAGSGGDPTPASATLDQMMRGGQSMIQGTKKPFSW